MCAYPRSSALTTDLYELTMAAAYFKHEMTASATFELFARDLPENRGYLVTCGLEPALEYLEELRFTAEDIGYLRGLPAFARVRDGFWDYLAALRFTGDVWAIAEGTPVMANEPLLRVTAPLIEAQILESYLLAVVNHQTLIATKAARVVDAARGRDVVDFGLRRAHGTDAAFWAARACYVGGCVGTSNVDAARAFGIPAVGTAAHSFTLAFGDETAAFEAYADTFPDRAILLIDTYDTLEGARRAARLGPKLAGVRLDSGDLAALSKEVRAVLDAAGCSAARIVGSGDLDEFRIAELLDAGAPIDLFGVGTSMIVSRDAPALSGVYKLVAIEDRPRAKRSAGKVNLPGTKQVARFLADESRYARDEIMCADEPVPGGAKPLLEPVMRGGRRIRPAPPLDELRERAARERAKLPPGVRRLRDPDEFPVSVSARLRALTDLAYREQAAQEGDQR